MHRDLSDDEPHLLDLSLGRQVHDLTYLLSPAAEDANSGIGATEPAFVWRIPTSEAISVNIIPNIAD